MEETISIWLAVNQNPGVQRPT